MVTLLAIGDQSDWESYLRFYRQRHLFRQYSFEFITTDYYSVLKGNLSKIMTKKIIVFLFFPFRYWYSKIAIKKETDVYGNRECYHKFRSFLEDVTKKIRKAYPDKNVCFLNEPKYLFIDRDKELTKRIVAKARVPVPKSYPTRNYKKILQMMDKGEKLFIKVRFGSLGKGITYLEKGRWKTNFRFRNGKIISKKTDHGWTFHEVTDNLSFLKGILKQDIIVEEDVTPFLIRGRKFDLRMYVCFGRVLYIFPRSNDCEQVTTNISQGARGEPQRFLKNIPAKALEQAKKNSIKATIAMKLNFAGVDVMIDVDGKTVSVIEVNAFPGFPKPKRYNLSKHLIKEIAKQRWGD